MIVRLLLTCLFICFITYSSAFAQIPTKHGENWSNLTELEKLLYLNGYFDGQANAYLFSILATADCNCGNNKERTFTRIDEVVKAKSSDPFDYTTISKVMTAIYKDPANIFISHSIMIELSISKLKGNNIEGDLIKYRKYAIEAHEDKQKNK